MLGESDTVRTDIVEISRLDPIRPWLLPDVRKLTVMQSSSKPDALERVVINLSGYSRTVLICRSLTEVLSSL